MTLPPGSKRLAGTVIHDEIVPARAPWLYHLAAGQTLRIVDLEGNQAVDFLLYSADDDAERYSAQDTVAAQGNLFLRSTIMTRSAVPAPASPIRCAMAITPRASMPVSRISSRPI